MADLKTVLTETLENALWDAFKSDDQDQLYANRETDTIDTSGGYVFMDRIAAHVAGVLLGLSGVAVTQLPEPDENGHFKVNPDSPTPIRVWGDPNGPTGPRVINGIPGDEFRWQDPEQALRMAGVLLAAAAAAGVFSEGATND